MTGLIFLVDTSETLLFSCSTPPDHPSRAPTGKGKGKSGSSKEGVKKGKKKEENARIWAGERTGEMLWARLTGFPWWPAEVCTCESEKGPVPEKAGSNLT